MRYIVTTRDGRNLITIKAGFNEVAALAFEDEEIARVYLRMNPHPAIQASALGDLDRAILARTATAIMLTTVDDVITLCKRPEEFPWAARTLNVQTLFKQ